MGIFAELKRRNVFRVGVAYVLGSWVLLQIIDLALEVTIAPDWILQVFFIAAAAGLPVVLFWAWVYEVTPDGIRKQSDIDREQSITDQTGRKLDRAIIGVLAVAVVLLLTERFTSSSTPVADLASPQLQAVEQTPVSADAVAPHSVAVLPFSTRSRLEDDRFFSDGMHDDLLTQLAKVSDLKVISRTSVMEYRDTTKNMREIGEELGVSTILEGAVQRSGRQVRINMQLIDSKTDEHLWAENYDRELTADNLFHIQTEIVMAVTEALQATLSPQEQVAISQRKLTQNMAALQAYQRSRVLSEFDTLENLRRSLEFALEAVELDPDFAEGWAQLAFSYLANYWHVDNNSQEYLDGAREAIERGRQLAPGLADLDLAEGFYYYWGHRDYDRALAAVEHLIPTHQNNATLFKLMSWIHRRAGNFEKSQELQKRAFALAPRALEVTSSIAETYWSMRDFENARMWTEVLEDLSPSSERLYELHVFSAQAAGDLQATAEALRKIKSYRPYDYWLSLASQGDYTTFTEYELLDSAQTFGRIFYPPDLVRGLTARLSGDPARASELLSPVADQLTAELERSPDDFKLLKPLCLAAGALNDSDKALQYCEAALQNLPNDKYDWSWHSFDAAQGLAMAGHAVRAIEIIESVMSYPVGPFTADLASNPMLASLHGQPRFDALLAP